MCGIWSEASRKRGHWPYPCGFFVTRIPHSFVAASASHLPFHSHTCPALIKWKLCFFLESRIFMWYRAYLRNLVKKGKIFG